MPLYQRFCTQPRWLLVLETVGTLLLIGYCDFATGWELSLFVFYAVPILVAVWCLGRTEGVLLALFSALTWWVANATVHPYRTTWGYDVATLSRLAYFVFVAIGGAALKSQREADRERIAALERTRALEGEIVRVAEEEQRRIGRDLHDGLCQFLAAINMSAKTLADDLEAEGVRKSAEAREIQELLAEGISQARGLARGLFPVQMDGAGLSVALDELVATTRRLTSLNITFSEEGDTRIPDPVVATQLYRIAQEALSNAMKHGGAKQIKIGLRRESDALLLDVRDNGRGVEPTDQHGRGFGFATMEYRARSIGGELKIDRASEGGTLVTCRVPVNATT
jgi:signal transduction histidine kinase